MFNQIPIEIYVVVNDDKPNECTRNRCPHFRYEFDLMCGLFNTVLRSSHGVDLKRCDRCVQATSSERRTNEVIRKDDNGNIQSHVSKKKKRTR